MAGGLGTEKPGLGKGGSSGSWNSACLADPIGLAVLGWLGPTGWLELSPQGRWVLYLSHDEAQRRRVTATSLGCASVSLRMSMNSLSSGGSSDRNLWCMFLTKPGTWRRHRETWRAARGIDIPSFP